jgi:hypothetical protein
MLSKCANPDCSASFHYLHDGRLFELHVGKGGNGDTSKKPSQNVERYWLCSKCSVTLTLAVDPDNKILVLPLRTRLRSAAAS